MAEIGTNVRGCCLECESSTTKCLQYQRCSHPTKTFCTNCGCPEESHDFLLFEEGELMAEVHIDLEDTDPILAALTPVSLSTHLSSPTSSTASTISFRASPSTTPTTSQPGGASSTIQTIVTPPPGAANSSSSSTALPPSASLTPNRPGPIRRSRKNVKIATKEATGSWSKNTEDIPLPKLSDKLVSSLTAGGSSALAVMDLVVQECAEHYVKFHFGHAENYKQECRKLWMTFPSIGVEGDKPWISFQKKLSRKVRLIRNKNRDKEDTVRLFSQADVVSTAPLNIGTTRPARSTFAFFNPSLAACSKDVLDRELQSENPDKGIVIQSLRNTFGLRTTLIEHSKDYYTLFDTYKCLMELDYILQEMSFIIGEAGMAKFKGNMQLLLRRILALTEQTELSSALLHMQTENSLKSGPVFLRHFEAEQEFYTALNSAKNSPPKLLIRRLEAQSEEVVITCYSKTITGFNGDISLALLVYLSLHLAFAIQYPSGCRGLLCAFEMFLFGHEIPIAKKQMALLTKLKTTARDNE